MKDIQHPAYQQLKEIFAELSQLEYLKNRLGFALPPTSTSYFEQAKKTFEKKIENSQNTVLSVGVLDKLTREILGDERIPDLLQSAESESLSPIDKENLRLMGKQYRLSKISYPDELLKSLRSVKAKLNQAYVKDSKKNWEEIEPIFAELCKIKQQMLEINSHVLNCSPYDVALGDYIPGFTQAALDEIIVKIKDNILRWREKICLNQSKQSPLKPIVELEPIQAKKLSDIIMNMMGLKTADAVRIYEYEFASTDGYPYDVEFYIPYAKKDPIDLIFDVIHETGHAKYLMGIPPAIHNQPVGVLRIDLDNDITMRNMAADESMALIFEHFICRSRHFWVYFSGLLQAEFGNHPSLSAENLYRYVNYVKLTPNRLEADPCSYVLHILLRYEIEKRLLAGELLAADIPKYWNEAMQKYLGVSSIGNDKDGVMQDPHWFNCHFGYFPAYLLGQCIAAQLYQAFEKEHPKFEQALAVGDFSLINNWLQKNVYKYGFFPVNEILIQATGEPLNPDYLIRHFEEKYLSLDLTGCETNDPLLDMTNESTSKAPDSPSVKSNLSKGDSYESQNMNRFFIGDEQNLSRNEVRAWPRLCCVTQ